MDSTHSSHGLLPGPGSSESCLRVLLIAELCNPDWSSIPLEGWFHSQAISRLVDSHLVTHVRNRPNLLAAGLAEGLDFTAIDSQAIERPLLWTIDHLGASIKSGKGWTTQTAVAAVTYQWFEELVWRRFRHALAARQFDLVHRLTPLSPTIPSRLAARCRRLGIPFVLGPLNGGLPWPKEFGHFRILEREWLSYVRGLYKTFPGYGSTRRNASAIIVGSRATGGQLSHRYRGKAVYIAENGVDPRRFEKTVSGTAEIPVKVIFVGRLVPYKGADMLLQAAAPLVRSGRIRVSVVGDGPQMPMIRQIVDREGLGAGVQLRGWLPHTEIQNELAHSDVFAFPSIREFGGAVVLEAMAVGLVPIVVDYGGPGELVDGKTGYKIPLGNRREIVERLRAVLDRLTQDPSGIRTAGLRAKNRVFDLFTWSAKASQVLRVYEWVLGRSAKPDFGPVA